MIVPLYKVPRYSRVRVQWSTVPPLDEELEFEHIDGMYSYCTTDDGSVVHLSASTPVEIVREGPTKSVAKRHKVISGG